MLKKNAELSDNSITGRGSPNCDRSTFRKLTPEHDAAIKAFIDFRYSSLGSLGAGKVCSVTDRTCGSKALTETV